MLSTLGGLLGAQEPRLLVRPEAVSSAGAEAVELAEAAGLLLDPWQRLALEVGLGERADGSWAAFEVALLVSRQNGKGAVLEARELAGLFLFGERLILHSAHEFKTAKEAFYRMRRLIEDCPDFDRRVKQIKQSNEEVSIELLSGQRLRYVARSSGGGRGFSGDCVILDEAYELGPDQMAALLPTLSARPNPQLWYTSSAPMRTSVQLHRVRQRAMSDTPARLALLEWSAGPDDDHADPAVWAATNPGMGIRISAEHVANEQDALDADVFARERLGVADVPPSAQQQAAIPEVVWASCRDALSAPVGKVAFAVDVALDRSFAAVAVAGRRADGRVHVELVRHEPGQAWVTPWLAERLRMHPSVGVGLDPASPAGSLIPSLVRAGIDPALITGRALAQTCGRVLDLAVEGSLRHLGQPSLDAAAAGAVRRKLGDAWAWDRKTGVDICPLVAATVALWVLESVEGAPVSTPRVVSLADL